MTEYEPQAQAEMGEVAAERRHFFQTNHPRAAALLMSGALLLGACSTGSGGDNEVSAAQQQTPSTEAPTTTQAPTTTTTMPEEEPWFEAFMQRVESTDGWLYEFNFELHEPAVSYSVNKPGEIDIFASISGDMKVSNPDTLRYTTPAVGPMQATALYASPDCKPEDGSGEWKYPGMVGNAGTINGETVCLVSTYLLGVYNGGSPMIPPYPSLGPGESWEEAIQDERKPIEEVPELSFSLYEDVLTAKPDYVTIGFDNSSTNFEHISCGKAGIFTVLDGDGREVPREQYTDATGECTLDFDIIRG